MKDRVKERWGILRAALLEGKVAKGSVSVRNHPGFNLFKKEKKKDNSEVGYTWEEWQYLYPPVSTDSSLLLRQKESTISVAELLHASDNTGNICIWPSEEVLAHYCCQNLSLFTDKKVCELAAGSSGLAGLCVAFFGQLSCVYITDGDEQAVSNIFLANIDKNQMATKNVTAGQLIWGKTEVDSSFDVIIAADCLFLEQFHTSLLDTLKRNLTRNGIALFVAPYRNGSLLRFVDCARLQGFLVEVVEDYNSHVASEHVRCLADPSLGYNTDLHLPVLVKLYFAT